MAYQLSSAMLHNFKLTLKYDSSGKILDLDDFKKKLVTILKAPITVEEIDAGKKQESITEVRVFVLIDSKRKALQAYFRKKLAKGNVVQYTAKMVDGKVRLVGKPALSPQQEEQMFSSLAKEAFSVSPFDDLGPIAEYVHNTVSELAPELGLKKKPH